MVFFVDGLDVGRLDAMLAEGKLPNIAERFVRGGVRVNHAIASMPSITYPNTVSLLTGQFPGHHGVLGNRWYDRRSLTIERYTTLQRFQNANRHFRAATLFEMLPNQLTIAVQLHTRRGATVAIDELARGGLLWLLGKYEQFDRRPAAQLPRIARIANRARRWPTLIVNYFPGVDEIGHRFGPDSDEYESSVRNIDEQIGRIFSALQQAGLADSTYFILVSDHGHVAHDPAIYLDVGEWLRERFGLRVYEDDLDKRDFAHRFATLDRYDAVVLSGAYRHAAIHLRGPSGWHVSPDPHTIAAIATSQLRRHPAVELVAVREAVDRVRVTSAVGSASIERRADRNGMNEYRLVAVQGDPLAMSHAAAFADLVTTGWHTSREWLAATAATRYPDFIPQIVEMFDSNRAGDIVLFASDRGTFELNGKGGHGSCLADDMNVPMFFAGPGLPRGGRIEYARSVDLTPTVLELLGKPLPSRAGPMDGISIAERLRNAATTTP